MPRKKGSKNKPKIEEKEVVIAEKTPKKEPEDRFVSVYEASEYLKTSEATIGVWVHHNHLIERGGKISMNSIRKCKFHTRRIR